MNAEPDTSPSTTAPIRSRPGRRYAKGEQRRQEILERTIEVVAERGVEGTTLRAIAEAIGFTHAAITRYFADREELFLAVLQEADQRGAAELAESRSASDFATRAAQISLRAPGLMALYNAMTSRALEPGNVASRSHFQERHTRLVEEITTTLRTGQEAGVIRRDIDPSVTAALLLGAADGLSVQQLLQPGDSFEAAMTLLDTLIAAP
ncbi:TetR/AcrR family transcriptional regulator [Kineosporia babensis]|uniref:TetR/AcrR family transcriptional regulator n=1 Tax=Kineosporia babensis TaxID=499548 RepID=A0A9X1NJZ8_9ACTN|nr:TetR/AcrR family transcriptional regulator [Kineosporia babensis]